MAVASQWACPVGVSLSCSPDHRLTGTRMLADRTPQGATNARPSSIPPSARGKTLAQVGKQVSGGLVARIACATWRSGVLCRAGPVNLAAAHAAAPATCPALAILGISLG